MSEGSGGRKEAQLVIEGGRLIEALKRAEGMADSPRSLLRHPLRQLRSLVPSWTSSTEVKCRIFTGQRMWVVLPEIVGTELYRRGYVEPSLTRVLLEFLQPGMTFFDVGAHYGYHSLVASLLVGPEGSVTAFEPGRSAYSLLVRNVGEVKNVSPRPMAVFSHAGIVHYRDFGARNSALNTALAGARVPPEERRTLRARTYTVPCTTLDQYAAATKSVPDFVKLDAEGAELAILEGMRGLLTQAEPMLAMETGDYEGMASPATTDCIDFLEALGYRCFEYCEGLRPHHRRSLYGYDNLFFVKAPHVDGSPQGSC